MAKRTDPRQIAKLVQVQHARRAAADAALIDAREAEDRARDAREDAREKASVAADDWLEFLSRPGFSPEYACDLASRLLAREALSDEAGDRLGAAEEVYFQRQGEWRLTEALVKLADQSLVRAKRAAGRVRDEKRLGELSDRITFGWMQG